MTTLVTRLKGAGGCGDSHVIPMTHYLFLSRFLVLRLSLSPLLSSVSLKLRLNKVVNCCLELMCSTWVSSAT
jgi:hypothetical protein